MQYADDTTYGMLFEECRDAFQMHYNQIRVMERPLMGNSLWDTSLEFKFRSLMSSMPKDNRLWSSVDYPGVLCIASISKFYILDGHRGTELMQRVPIARRSEMIQTRQYEMALAMKKGVQVGVLLNSLNAGFKANGNPLKELRFGVVESVHDGLITVKHVTSRSVVSTTYNMSKLREDPLHPLIRPPPEVANLLDDDNFCIQNDLYPHERLVVFINEITVRGQLAWAGQLASGAEIEVLILTDDLIRQPHLLFHDYYCLYFGVDPDRVYRVPITQAVKERHMDAKSGLEEVREEALRVSSLHVEPRPDSLTPPLPPDIGCLVVGPNNLHGVLRWIGTSLDDSELYAGVETDDRSPSGSDGTFEGIRRFACDRGFARFLPLRLLQRDRRFAEDPRNDVDRYQNYLPTPEVPTKPPVETSDEDDEDDDEEDTYRPQQPTVVMSQQEALSPAPVISPHRVNAETPLHLFRSIVKPPVVSRDLLSSVIDTVEQKSPSRPVTKRAAPTSSPALSSANGEPNVPARPPRALPRAVDRENVRRVHTWREGDLVRLAKEARTIGRVRWIGESREHVPMLGLELLAPDPRSTNGVYEGQLRFRSKSGAPNMSLFVKETEVIEAGDDDHLVAELAELNVTHPSPQRKFGHSPTPDVVGTVAPLNSKDYRRMLGRSKGIQGHCNSCYLDSILFSLFSFSAAMDASLFRPSGDDDIEQFVEVQRLLREGIVNPLRRHRFVRADKVMRLRETLGRVVDKDDMRYSQKDIEELFTCLMERTLRVEPLIRLSSGEKTNMYQLFLESKAGLPKVPETQTLLELSLACSQVKFTEEPSVLLMLMPRHSAVDQLFQKVIPSPEIDLSYCVAGYPHNCFNCERAADVECLNCVYDIEIVPSLKVAFQCRSCSKKYHAREREHRAEKVSVSEEFQRSRSPVPMRLLLIAVICIRNSHYVSYVRCGTTARAPWVFFDSMAERIEGSHNLPAVQEVDVNRWLEAALESMAGKRDRLKDDLNVSALVPDPSQTDMAERLFGDAYMCIYQSPNASIYK